MFHSLQDRAKETSFENLTVCYSRLLSNVRPLCEVTYQQHTCHNYSTLMSSAVGGVVYAHVL